MPKHEKMPCSFEILEMHSWTRSLQLTWNRPFQQGTNQKTMNFATID